MHRESLCEREPYARGRVSPLANLSVLMNRLFCLTFLSISLAATLAAGASSSPAAVPFRSKISPLGPELRAQMTGVSWHRGCPVPLSGLRLLTLSYRGFDQRSYTGRLVVNKTVAGKVVAVFRKLYRAGFPIRHLQLVDAYGGSDFRSIEADNTSAFNCRNATGSSHWSNHAYGLAIDIDPIENPYVTGGALVAAFRSIGWGWGGYWSGDRDYQHFSANGR